MRLVHRPVSQRWRERPRCLALRVAPALGDGVVHAIAGRARVSRVCAARFVRKKRAARVPVRVVVFLRTTQPTNQRAHWQDVRALLPESARRSPYQLCACTIAHSILVPCSASSMLFAALRPGPRPGLRALTTPARGTTWAIARWPVSDGSSAQRDSSERQLTREFRRRMLMYRVCAPRHILRIAHQCMRSAFPVVALRARFKRTPTNIASGCCALTLRGNGASPDSRSRGRSSTLRLEDPASLRVAFTEAHARPCLGRTLAHDGRVAPDDRHRAEPGSRGSMSAPGPHPRSTDIDAPASSRRVGARNSSTNEQPLYRQSGGAP